MPVIVPSHSALPLPSAARIALIPAQYGANTPTGAFLLWGHPPSAFGAGHRVVILRGGVNTEPVNSESVVRRSGRPLTFDRTEALGRLMSLFWRIGFDGVTQQQMAAVTGLSTSSLYNSFGTKADIYREAMSEYLRRMQFVLDPLEHGDRGCEDVLEMLARMEAVLIGPDGGFGCMATAAMSTPMDDEVAGATRGYREQLRAGLLAVAQRARSLGESTPEPPVVANVMTAAVLGTLTIARADPEGHELPAQMDALRDFVNGWRSR
jgi:TetR/AcrR family transcriptional regulator, transcriptional repressor for nem operon